MKKHIRPRKLVLMLVLPWICGFGYAQYDMTMYAMDGVVQTNVLNPAFIPNTNMHFGVPGLSNVYGGIGTSGARFSNAFERQADDSLMFTPNNMLDHTKNRNNIGASATVQWLNFGMKYWGNWYFNASLSDVATGNLSYSKDLLELGIKGNGAFIGETADIGKTNIKYLHYRQFALGAAYDYNDQWNFGAKLKFLFGKSAIVSKNLEAKLTTSDNSYFLSNDMNILIHTAVPDTWLGRDESMLSGNYWFYAGSYGLAMDFGATYKLDEQLSFSASVLDVGYVSFTRDVTNFTNETGSWSFKGLDLISLRDLDNNAFEDELEHIGDSLINKFNLTEDYGKFTTMLSAKVYLGGQYELDANQTVSAVMRNEFIQGKWRLGFTGAYKYKVNQYFSAYGSYTLAERGYGNFGIGLQGSYKMVQAYFVTDNFVGVFVPDKMRYANMHFGVNIMLNTGGGRSLLD